MWTLYIQLESLLLMYLICHKHSVFIIDSENSVQQEHCSNTRSNWAYIHSTWVSLSLIYLICHKHFVLCNQYLNFGSGRSHKQSRAETQLYLILGNYYFKCESVIAVQEINNYYKEHNVCVPQSSTLYLLIRQMP